MLDRVAKQFNWTYFFSYLFFIWAQAVDSCNQENPSATTAQAPNKYDAKIGE